MFVDDLGGVRLSGGTEEWEKEVGEASISGQDLSPLLFTPHLHTPFTCTIEAKGL